MSISLTSLVSTVASCRSCSHSSSSSPIASPGLKVTPSAVVSPAKKEVRRSASCLLSPACVERHVAVPDSMMYSALTGVPCATTFSFASRRMYVHTRQSSRTASSDMRLSRTYLSVAALATSRSMSVAVRSCTFLVTALLYAALRRMICSVSSSRSSSSDRCMISTCTRGGLVSGAMQKWGRRRREGGRSGGGAHLARVGRLGLDGG